MIVGSTLNAKFAAIVTTTTAAPLTGVTAAVHERDRTRKEAPSFV